MNPEDQNKLDRELRASGRAHLVDGGPHPRSLRNNAYDGLRVSDCCQRVIACNVTLGRTYCTGCKGQVV